MRKRYHTNTSSIDDFRIIVPSVLLVVFISSAAPNLLERDPHPAASVDRSLVDPPVGVGAVHVAEGEEAVGEAAGGRGDHAEGEAVTH